MCGNPTVFGLLNGIFTFRLPEWVLKQGLTGGVCKLSFNH